MMYVYHFNGGVPTKDFKGTDAECRDWINASGNPGKYYLRVAA